MTAEVRYAGSHYCCRILPDLPGYGRDSVQRHGHRAQGAPVQLALGRPAKAIESKVVRSVPPNLLSLYDGVAEAAGFCAALAVSGRLVGPPDWYRATN